MIKKPPMKVGAQRWGAKELTQADVPSPETFAKQVADTVRFHYGDKEDFGYDYPLFQHLQAFQGTLELHVTACKARESHDAQDAEKDACDDQPGRGNEDAMADAEEMPPSKRAAKGGWDRRHGWTDTPASAIPVPQDGEEGTVTPKHLQSSSQAMEMEFPSLEEAASSQGQIPTPTAQVLRGFKADTRRALAEARSAARTRLKGKQKSTQAEGKSSAAEEAMDSLLRETKASGTPAGGSESGTLGRATGTSSASSKPSAEAQGASGATSSGASGKDTSKQSEAPIDDTGQPSAGESHVINFRGGVGEDDL